MSPPRKRFRVWKVNLVEQQAWAPWDPSGEISEKAFLMTSDYMQDIKEEGAYFLLVQDIAKSLYQPRSDSGPHEWSPRPQLTTDDLRLIAKGTMEAEPGLEQTRELIENTVTWMYEAALMPAAMDARDALNSAKNRVIKSFTLGEMPDPWELGYDNLWAPLLETGITLEGILSELVRMGIRYDQEPGHYDRFLEFDLNKASAPFMLLDAVPKKDRGWVARSIEFDWKRLSQDLVESFFLALSDDMKTIDPSNRISWKTSWNEALKTTDLKPLQKEMLDYVKEVRRQEGSRL